MTLVHKVDGQVIEARNKQRICREVRHTHRRKVTDAFLADNHVSGHGFGISLFFVDDREIFVGQKLTAYNHYQIGVFLIPRLDKVVSGVHHQGVEVFVVATLTDADHVGNDCAVVIGDLVHHTAWGLFAVLLHPAHGHILKQRIFRTV